MSAAGTPMDDESIEGESQRAGDGRAGVPSAIPVSADDGLFGGRTQKARMRSGVMIDTGARMLIKLPGAVPSRRFFLGLAINARG
jgi:hypothetical protein